MWGWSHSESLFDSIQRVRVFWEVHLEDRQLQEVRPGDKRALKDRRTREWKTCQTWQIPLYLFVISILHLNVPGWPWTSTSAWSVDDDPGFRSQCDVISGWQTTWIVRGSFQHTADGPSHMFTWLEVLGLKSVSGSNLTNLLPWLHLIFIFIRKLTMFLNWFFRKNVFSLNWQKRYLVTSLTLIYIKKKTQTLLWMIS